MRIETAIEPPLAEGELRIYGKALPELDNEMVAFPAAAHDDLVGALAGTFDAKGKPYLPIGQPTPPPKPKGPDMSAWDSVGPDPAGW